MDGIRRREAKVSDPGWIDGLRPLPTLYTAIVGLICFALARPAWKRTAFLGAGNTGNCRPVGENSIGHRNLCEEMSGTARNYPKTDSFDLIDPRIVRINYLTRA